MAAKANIQVTVRDMMTGAKLPKAAVRVYYEMPVIPVKKYLSPVLPGAVLAPPEPKRVTDANGAVDIKYSLEAATRYFYMLVTKPGYAPVVVAASLMESVKSSGEIYTEVDGKKIYRSKTAVEVASLDIYPKEVFMCKLPDPPPGFTAVFAPDVSDPRTLPGSPATFIDYPNMDDAEPFGQFVSGPDTWIGPEPAHWGDKGESYPASGADGGPCGPIIGWIPTTTPPVVPPVTTPPPTMGFWWQYVLVAPPDPMTFSGDSDLAAAYTTWFNGGHPSGTGPLPSPLTWWQATMTPPPEPTMFGTVNALASAYRSWYAH